MGNATATGSVLLLDRGQGVIITDNPITLLCETVFFLSLALLIIVKLIDKLVRKRYDMNDRGGNCEESRHKVQEGRKRKN